MLVYYKSNYYTTKQKQIFNRGKKQSVPVDPTDQVMFRLKLFEALMDMSKFLLVYQMKRENKVDVCKITIFR